MIVKVTQKNINEGHSGCDWACPVANAIHKAGYFWNVSVGDEQIILNDTTYTSPQIVRDFVARFDSNLPVVPFSFVIAEKT